MTGVDFIFLKAFTVCQVLTRIFSGYQPLCNSFHFCLSGQEKDFNDKGILTSEM